MNDIKLIKVDSTVIPFKDSLPKKNLGAFRAPTRVGKEAKGDMTKGTSSLVNPPVQDIPEQAEGSSLQDSLLNSLDSLAASGAPVDSGSSRYKSKNPNRKVFGVPNSDAREQALSSSDRGSALQFNPIIFKDRITKFFKTRKNDLKKAYTEKPSTLKTCLEEYYNSYFMSPRVRIEFEQLYNIVRDLLEFDTLENSPAYDSLLDSKGIDLLEHPPMESQVHRVDKSIGPTSFIPQQAIKSSKESVVKLETIKSTPNFDKHFSFGSPLCNYCILDRDTSLVIQDSNAISTGLKQGTITILKCSDFEKCKQFKCSKYDVFSVSEIGLKMKKVPTSSNSTLFKACCSSFNLEGCPQSSIYTEMEQMMYDSILEVSKDLEIAHNTVLSMRLKAIK